MKFGSFVSFLLILGCTGQPELLKNPDFEQPFQGRDNWFCNNGCVLDKSTDAYEGSYSGRVTQRTNQGSSISQYVPVEAGKSYGFHHQFKLLNQLPDRLYHQISHFLHVQYVDGSQKYQYLGKMPRLKVAEGWTLVGGDFTIENKAVRQARLYIKLTEPEINYLMDAASMKEILPNPNWRQEADARIENIRKRDIEIRFKARDELNPNDIKIHVNQTWQEFPFGSAVKAQLISGTDAQSRRYQDTFYSLFNWAVLENALKWRQMERSEGNVNYEKADAGVQALNERGIPVRGHCVTWANPERCPAWLVSKSGDEVKSHVDRRVNDVVNRYSMLEHWDVNNEAIHFDFFENKTRDPWYTEEIIRKVAAQDKDVKLFFNDFQIVNMGYVTYAYVGQIKHALSNNVPFYGMGAQSHMPEFFNLDSVKHRLDIAASAGVPIWITEMSVQSDDRGIRAQNYENLLRLYFSYPAVEGILLWGFWDGAHYKPRAAIVEGQDFQLNEAGLRIKHLTQTEWRTDTHLTPRGWQDTLQLRGFHGNYTVTVTSGGQMLGTRQFELPKGEGPVVVNVEV